MFEIKPSQFFSKPMQLGLGSSPHGRALTLLLSLCFAVLWSTPALAQNGSISGAISSSSGAGLDTLEVELFRKEFEPTSGSFWSSINFAMPTSDGTFSFSELEPGEYTIGVYDYNYPSIYVSEYYDNQPEIESASTITVADGENVTGIEIVLEEYGKVSGTVTDENDNPLFEVPVSWYINDSGSWYEDGTIFTDADGRYTLVGLRNGSTRIRFGPEFVDPFFPFDYVAEYYDNATDINSATDVVVASGSTTPNIDAKLAKVNKLSGRITNSNGDGLGNIDVTLYEPCCGSSWNYSQSVTTNQDGEYSFYGMQPGVYRVGAQDYNFPSNYMPTYYENATDVESASNIDVLAGDDISDIDITMSEFGRIEGTVTDSDGNLLGNIPVTYYIYDFDYWSMYDMTYTEADGSYSFVGLASGAVRIGFGPDYPDPFNPFDYVAEFYNDASTIESATDITVVSGSATTGIDAQLAKAGKISGKITRSNGTAAENVEIQVFTQLDLNGFFDWYNVGMTTSAADGTYVLGGLDAGTYRIAVYDYGSSDYQEIYYDGAQSLETATDIPVALGEEVSGIDVQLLGYGSISGKVLGQDNEPLMDVEVILHVEEGDPCCPGWNYQTSAYTDLNGEYQFLSAVREGTYRISFVPAFSDEYQTEYYENAVDIESAADVIVGGDETIVLNDVVLDKLGSVSGIVTDVDDNPLSNIEVSAEQWVVDEFTPEGYWMSFGYATTSNDGSYTMASIISGTYRIKFLDASAALYLEEYYDNVFDINDAADIDMGLNQVVTGINAQLDRPGALQGQVSDSDGNSLQNIAVVGYMQQDDGTGNTIWTDVLSASTDQDGKYELTAPPYSGSDLGFGTFRVCFHDDGINRFIAVCYGGVASVESAQDIEVALNEIVSGIDAVLEESGEISGTVSDADGAPLADISLTVYQYQPSTDEWINSHEGGPAVMTDAEGKYVAAPLMPGTYRILFNGGERYVPSYYNSATTLDAAADIEVTSGQMVTAIDAQLLNRTAIIGKVTDENGIPLSSIFVGLYSQTASTETVFAQAITATLTETWDLIRSEVTDADGSFGILDVAPGTYRIGFNNADSLYHSEFFGEDAYYISQATDVVVVDGSRIENVNAQMAGISLNVPPLAQEDDIVVQEAGESSELVGLSRSLLANDKDAEAATLTAMLVVSPTHGSLTLNNDGTFAYKHDGSETLSDEFAYVASDGVNTSEVISVSITVMPTNDAPIAVTDAISVTQGGTVEQLISGESSILANDSDEDSSQLSVVLVEEPAFGTLTLNEDGTFAYSHIGGESKTDSFVYKVSDGEAESEPVDVTIQIKTSVGSDEPLDVDPPSASGSIFLPFVSP